MQISLNMHMSQDLKQRYPRTSVLVSPQSSFRQACITFVLHAQTALVLSKSKLHLLC